VPDGFESTHTGAEVEEALPEEPDPLEDDTTVGVGVGVGVAAVVTQLVRLVPYVFVALNEISVALLLFESLTSTYVILLVPCGSIPHCVPVEDDLRLNKLLNAPLSVRAFSIVWVELA
jgi:hypothetical protein